MNKKLFLLVPVIAAGVTLGFSVNSGEDGGYCSELEEEIKNNQKFNGSLACFKPGVLEVNLSQEVENSSELRCICRKINDHGVNLYPVAVSQ